MKRFFLLLLTLLKQRFILYATAAVLGAISGILLLYPINDFVYFYEHGVPGESAFSYVFSQLQMSVHGKTPQKTLFYAQVGLVLGLFLAWIYSNLHRRLQRIEQLSDELYRDLPAMIKQGEGPMLEFKSSFRWDTTESRINRNLEQVVLKTLAGFLNSHNGGALLIGVADNGDILGLANDYQTFKKQNQDGFEQAIMTAISTNLGADLCQDVRVLFHKIENRDVCRLIIIPSPRPVFLKQGHNPKFFLRTGGGTRDLNIQEATEFIATRWSK